MTNLFKTLSIVFLILSGFSLSSAAEPPTLVLVEGSPFIVDLRYNSDNNFLKKNVYAPFHLNECYVHQDMLGALLRAEPFLKAQKLKLIFWDCYRPLEVQKAMWKIVPDSRYVADPAKGSNHNRGVAVDVTLANADGTELPMPTGFDDFSPRAASSYKCRPEEKELCANRETLKKIMSKSSLASFPTEWWHYQLPKSKNYPVISQGTNPSRI